MAHSPLHTLSVEHKSSRFRPFSKKLRRRPSFCESTPDAIHLCDATLVQDAMFVAKFLSALKVSTRLHVRKRTGPAAYGDVRTLLVRIADACAQWGRPFPVTHENAAGPSVTRTHSAAGVLDDGAARFSKTLRMPQQTVQAGATLGETSPSTPRVKHGPAPSLNCARMPTITEEPLNGLSMDVGPMPVATPFQKAHVTGPKIKRRGGMSVLTSLVEEDEEEEGERSDNDESSASSMVTTPDESLEDAFAPPSITALFTPTKNLRYNAPLYEGLPKPCWSPNSDLQNRLQFLLAEHHRVVCAEQR